MTLFGFVGCKCVLLQRDHKEDTDTFESVLRRQALLLSLQRLIPAFKTSDLGPPLAGIFLSDPQESEGNVCVILATVKFTLTKATSLQSTPSTSIVFRVLFCALLATSVGQSVMLTTLPSLGREATLSEFHIATIMSSSALIFALGTNVWSKVAKRAGFKRILIVGLAGYSLGTFAFASAWMAGFSGIISGTNLFLALLISRSMQSTIMSATPPSAVGYAVAISSPKARVSAISKVTSASSVGQIIGPAYAGLLVGFGLLAPLYSIVILTLLALVLVYFKLPVLHPAFTQQQRTENSVINASASRIPYIFVLACICVFCAMAMMQQSIGFFFIDFYKLSPVEGAQLVGFAMMMSALTSISVQFLIVQRSRLRTSTMIQISLPVLVIAYALLYFQQSIAMMYIGMAFMGLGMGMAYPSLAASATTFCTLAQQPRITGLITASTAMGYVVGPPVAAYLYQQDIALPFLAGAIIIAITTCIVFMALRAAKYAFKP